MSVYTMTSPLLARMLPRRLVSCAAVLLLVIGVLAALPTTTAAAAGANHTSSFDSAVTRVSAADPCTALTNCSSCVAADVCQWCNVGDGFCANPKDATCSGNEWAAVSSQCPASSSGGTGDDGVTPFTTAGLVESSVILLVLLAGILLSFPILKKYRVTVVLGPVFGSTSDLDDANDTITDDQFLLFGLLVIFLVLLSLIGLISKVHSLVIDRWDGATLVVGGVETHTYFGVVNTLSKFWDYEDSDSATIASVLRQIAAVWTVGSGVASALCSLFILISGVRLMRMSVREARSRRSLVTPLQGKGSLTLLAAQWNGFALISWAAFHVTQQSVSSLARSWHHMLGALILVDLVAILIMRLLVRPIVTRVNEPAASPVEDQLHEPADIAHDQSVNRGDYQPLSV